jgi:hypothetical protein
VPLLDSLCSEQGYCYNNSHVGKLGWPGLEFTVFITINLEVDWSDRTVGLRTGPDRITVSKKLWTGLRHSPVFFSGTGPYCSPQKTLDRTVAQSSPIFWDQTVM